MLPRIANRLREKQERIPRNLELVGDGGKRAIGHGGVYECKPLVCQNPEATEIRFIESEREGEGRGNVAAAVKDSSFYRARPKGGPQVAGMLQTKPGRSGEQEQ